MSEEFKVMEEQLFRYSELITWILRNLEDLADFKNEIMKKEKEILNL